jgi:MFS family permease
MLQANTASEVESSYAWVRLAASVAIGSIATVGMWSVPVVLSAVQSNFGVARADASLPFTLAMTGFALGGVLMGRLSDRFGILAPLACGAGLMGLGYIGAGLAPSLMVFALMHLLIGFGTSATFGPIMADASRWFTRRRGIAVALAGSGNYVGGAIWPPVLQHFVAGEGWRATHIGVGVFCAVSVLPLLFIFVRRPPTAQMTGASIISADGALGLSPNALQILLCIAGVGCCVAMAMPQVHIVAYCGDLGYGVARGAEMLSLMLACGLVSRIGSGLVADRIGGAATLLLGSALQGLALFLYLLFDGLASLYVISALFGLFQGGIVPMYAVLVRDYFPAREAGTRLGIVLMATLLGMALGGWMSGMIFDLTGSYRAAFLNGLVWNLLNVVIVLWLVLRPGPRPPARADVALGSRAHRV